jgi:hypothetical protein
LAATPPIMKTVETAVWHKGPSAARGLSPSSAGRFPKIGLKGQSSGPAWAICRSHELQDCGCL